MVTGFLHPGEMGASLAAACRDRRVWSSAGRSEATKRRAADAGIEDVGSLAALVDCADVIISVCPPAAAAELAAAVAERGFDGVYVDVNAIAPETARLIGGQFAQFVDGGVIGPPVRSAGATRLYLSGAAAADVAGLWSGTQLETRLVDGGAGAASAVKVCFAAWTKGTAALLLAIRALAAAEGVERALLDEWATSMSGLAAQSDAAASTNAPKAWRFAGELDEIASSFTANHLPGGFGSAAAEVYDRLAGFKGTVGTTVAEVVDALLARG
jgi:3-hydroxyisobutyrate dehydrogenase-like beta-hydroxyacid dehydrogenase